MTFQSIMRSGLRSLCVGAAAAFTMVTTAGAQDNELGERLYMEGCASCHGESGLGTGPIAEYLTITPPPLTRLAAENEGEFPMLEVLQIIDGRTGVRGHGTETMPVWGAVFKRPLASDIGEYAAELIVRGRILSLALYLESIQE